MISRREKTTTREQVLDIANESILRDWFYVDRHGDHTMNLDDFVAKWHSMQGSVTRIPANLPDCYLNWIHVYDHEQSEYLEFVLERKNGNHSNGAATPRGSRRNKTIYTGDIYALLC